MQVLPPWLNLYVERLERKKAVYFGHSNQHDQAGTPGVFIVDDLQMGLQTFRVLK
jgi:hypothetical protein